MYWTRSQSALTSHVGAEGVGGGGGGREDRDDGPPGRRADGGDDRDDQAIPTGERLRPDAELQRLGPAAEREARHRRLRREGGGSLAAQSRAVGGGARLPAAPRPRVPSRATRRPAGGGARHPPEEEHRA